MDKIDYRPIIIIGAPRSGTNMLRDVLASMPGSGTWPCDEINSIWRHGNISQVYDDFGPELATPDVCRFIRSRFSQLARKKGLDHVVEKTCANSLRVSFVEEILPEAFYVHIVRNGVDAVASAMKRWHAGLDLAYVLKKARFIPPSDFPHYALRQLRNRLFRFFSTEKRLAYWGPRTREIEEAMAGGSLAMACAIQWRQCVELAARDLKRIPDDRICRVQYEDFVRQPEAETRRICQDAGISLPKSGLSDLLKKVSVGSVGRGRMELGKDLRDEMASEIKGVLERYGYV